MAKPSDIERWHFYIRHLGYKNLKTLKDLRSEINFKDIAPKELYEKCQKKCDSPAI